MRLPQIVALGGSLLRPEESENRKIWFGKLRQLAVHIEGNSRKLGIVVGGGLPAREGIDLAKNLVSDADRLDEIKNEIELANGNLESGNGNVESGNGNVESGNTGVELEPQPIPANLVLP